MLITNGLDDNCLKLSTGNGKCPSLERIDRQLVCETHKVQDVNAAAEQNNFQQLGKHTEELSKCN